MDCTISCPICSKGDELNVNESENVFFIANVLVYTVWQMVIQVAEFMDSITYLALSLTDCMHLTDNPLQFGIGQHAEIEYLP